MSRQISYTSKDFTALKSQLMEFGTKYFPDKFNNFNDYSIEMLLIELMSYVGDTLNFNIDDKYRQNFIQYATELEAIFRIAKSLGYKVKTASVAIGEVEFSQLVPASGSLPNRVPDLDFAASIEKGTVVSDNSNEFLYELINRVPMTDYDRMEIETVDEFDNPEYFRIFKTGTVRSGAKRVKNINITDYKTNLELFLDSNVAYIQSIVDSEGNSWYEVNNLAQDYIFEKVENETFSQYKDETQYLLKVRKVARRFITDHRTNGECFIQFGQGNDLIVNDLKSLGYKDLISNNSLANLNLNSSFIADNFFNEDAYGLVPANTTLTVTYVTSRGDEDNAKANTLVNLSSPIITFGAQEDSTVRRSFAVNNNNPISGASFLNSIEKIKFEAPLAFSSQSRCVTIKDYMIRCKMMPPEFGQVEKVFVEKDIDYRKLERTGFSDMDKKSINVYALSKNKNGQMKPCNIVTKNNLRNYINEFRMATDSINIIDPYIINIGVYFEYIARRDYNREEVELRLSRRVAEFFNIDRWDINQPIMIEDLRNYMFEVEGVLAIPKIDFNNKFDIAQDYSGVKYDVSTMGNNFDSDKGVLYPPMDISIFELKFPLTDITFKHV